MTTSRRTRRWTARLTIGGQDYDVQKSVNDTLRNQREDAIGLARAYVAMGLGSDAAVILYKTIGKGTEHHSAVYVYRDDRDGQIKVQR